jgi:hypothetical protein
MSFGEGVSTALDAVSDIAKPSLDVVRVSCSMAEWAIVSRDGTDERTDVIDLESVRAECDRLYQLWDAWVEIDSLVRKLLKKGQTDAAMKVLPEATRAAWNMRNAIMTSPIVSGGP